MPTEEVADWWDWDAAEAAGELEPEPDIAQGVHMGAGAGLLGPGLLPEGGCPTPPPLYALSTCLPKHVWRLGGGARAPEENFGVRCLFRYFTPRSPRKSDISAKFKIFVSECTCTLRLGLSV